MQALQPGTWLEFCLADEAMTRAKLSWISPMSGRYLFVNRRGLKVADYAPQELAVLLADGQRARARRQRPVRPRDERHRRHD